jgi:hypothetical protein
MTSTAGNKHSVTFVLNIPIKCYDQQLRCASPRTHLVRASGAQGPHGVRGCRRGRHACARGRAAGRRCVRSVYFIL